MNRVSRCMLMAGSLDVVTLLTKVSFRYRVRISTLNLLDESNGERVSQKCVAQTPGETERMKVVR